MSNFMLTCTTLKPGKAGILTPDADGCYTIPLGGINCFNSAGHYYDAPDSVIQLLTAPDSELQRQISKGMLFAENGHPKRLPGMTDDEFLLRARQVYEERACCQIVKIWIDRDNYKAPNGTPVIAIMGKVKPAGELGYVAKEAFANRLQDTCFSIRGFTYERRVSGILYKTLVDIRTFDMVIEPGIEHATKYHSSALESYAGFSLGEDTTYLKITEDVIRTAQQKAREHRTDSISMESAYSDINEFSKRILAPKNKLIFTQNPLWA